jgi:hypothetical protein
MSCLDESHENSLFIPLPALLFNFCAFYFGIYLKKAPSYLTAMVSW